MRGETEGTGGQDENILVSVRLRPLNDKETTRNDISDWECINNTTIVCRHGLPERSMLPSAYTFGMSFPFLHLSLIYFFTWIYIFTFNFKFHGLLVDNWICYIQRTTSNFFFFSNFICNYNLSWGNICQLISQFISTSLMHFSASTLTPGPLFYFDQFNGDRQSIWLGLPHEAGIWARSQGCCSFCTQWH